MNKNKLNNQYTINFDDDYKKLIDLLSDAYNRKPAELLRLLLIPVLHNEYIKLIKAGQYNDNDFTKPVYKN